MVTPLRVKRLLLTFWAVAVSICYGGDYGTDFTSQKCLRDYLSQGIAVLIACRFAPMSSANWVGCDIPTGLYGCLSTDVVSTLLEESLFLKGF